MAKKILTLGKEAFDRCHERMSIEYDKMAAQEDIALRNQQAYMQVLGANCVAVD